MVDFWYGDELSYYLAEEVDSDTQYATLTLNHICNREDFVPCHRKILIERRRLWIWK
jgi:hypothetical protein